ncbi:Deoxyuridine 5'-triphosphate nucleotidohydrolase [Apostasia shenzhenica]|uniref:Deoxyuridine 5'-triphosphate nucleotidohydrolase n=1 Tax=Apostasia shenzhenica TaxID=1088818 RepID=A0A2I0B2C1_9ASPA|nr:Deoxyuridine 5'-triphosphate nucleotidohydrolase [Apostasia shenzhenica]
MAGICPNLPRFSSLNSPITALPPPSSRFLFKSETRRILLSSSLFRATMVANGGSFAPPFLKVKKLSPNAILPSRASPLSAGYDLSSATAAKVPARGKALIPTDLSIAIPEGAYARIAPRSGLAWKHSIDVGAGVIDADYRGPVGVVLFNHSDVDFEVNSGDRIAQLILEKIMTLPVIEEEELDITERGSGGFGSTGV